ncbi:MAG: zinc-dependent metalloprotease [Bacteroidetes bacterium]|nr:zinc-dependent metalloprotease [Bacteroidota bacterium]
MPFTPVSYKDQKKAMQLLSQFAFSKNSFETPSNLANYLQMQRRDLQVANLYKIHNF